MSNVYIFTLVTDSEPEVRVFQTEEARDRAIRDEVTDRYAAAQEIGQVHQEDLGNLGDALDDPSEFITNITFGDTELSKSTVKLEG